MPSSPLYPEPSQITPIDALQATDLPALVDFLAEFWQEYARQRAVGRVAPAAIDEPIHELLGDRLPQVGTSLDKLLPQAARLLHEHCVKTSHPAFLGYVTPPSLDIAALGDALAAITNQNVSFSALSPLGSTLEAVVLSWLAELVGYAVPSGGILTSGGSHANLYALAAARRHAIGRSVNELGNAASDQPLRIYCSEYTHHSIDKAAILLGLGTSSVRRLSADSHHRLRPDDLKNAILNDLAAHQGRPFAVVANAGTRLTCAYDDVRALSTIAKEHGLWLHVDGAYGAFLGLANEPPEHADSLGIADSITMDPHKLLFSPFDCGALLVRNRHRLAQCFGTEGEYIELANPSDAFDFADLGVQLGRSMKALKVWLTLKYLGVDRLAKEYTRLMALTQLLKAELTRDSSFELLGPAPGIAICFRWRGGTSTDPTVLDGANRAIRQGMLRRGSAFIDEIRLHGRTGLRVCFTNFRTQPEHIMCLMRDIRTVATQHKG